MKVIHKETNKEYKVYDIKYDSNGYPNFLIYNDNSWLTISAKHFRPIELNLFETVKTKPIPNKLEFKNGSSFNYCSNRKEDIKRSSFVDWYHEKVMERFEESIDLIIDLELVSGYWTQDLIQKFKDGYKLVKED